jgi:hypothetical protein
MTDQRTTELFLAIQLTVARFYALRDLELATKRAARAHRKGDVSRLDEEAAAVLDMCAQCGTFVPHAEEEAVAKEGAAA